MIYTCIHKMSRVNRRSRNVFSETIMYFPFLFTKKNFNRHKWLSSQLKINLNISYIRNKKYELTFCIAFYFHVKYLFRQKVDLNLNCMYILYQ
jgi:hypothetical protein